MRIRHSKRLGYKRDALTSLNWAQNNADMLEVYIMWSESELICRNLENLMSRFVRMPRIIPHTMICERTIVHNVTLL